MYLPFFFFFFILYVLSYSAFLAFHLFLHFSPFLLGVGSLPRDLDIQQQHRYTDTLYYCKYSISCSDVWGNLLVLVLTALESCSGSKTQHSEYKSSQFSLPLRRIFTVLLKQRFLHYRNWFCTKQIRILIKGTDFCCKKSVCFKYIFLHPR